MAPRTRRDDVLELPEDVSREAVNASVPPPLRLLAVLWAGFAALLIGFLLLGSVRVGAGNWSGRRIQITQIWSRFLYFLSEQGASAVVISIITLAVIAAIVGSTWLVWLALRLDDADVAAPPKDAVGS